MTAESVVTAGRRFSETIMTTQCAIARETGQTMDENTLLYVPVMTAVWAGACRLKFSTNRVSPREVEGQLDTAQQLLLYVPVVGTGEITVNDTVTITDGGFDPTLTGRVFRVTGLFNQSYATSRRLPLEAIV